MASAKDRIQKTKAKRQGETKAPTPAASANTDTRVPVDTDEPRATTSRYPANYPHRMTLDLSKAQHEGMRRKSYEADIPKAHIIRSLIDLYFDDPALAARAEEAARNQG